MKPVNKAWVGAVSFFFLFIYFIYLFYFYFFFFFAISKDAYRFLQISGDLLMQSNFP